MRIYLLFFIIFIIILAACSHNHEQTQQSTFAPKVVEAHGYVVPKDSMAEPKVILVDESKLKKIAVGKPSVIPTNTNIHPAGKPKIITGDMPKSCTSGQDTFLLPKIVPAIDSPFIAGIPEVVIAKDAYIFDQNPHNFSSFNKLQGLKHNNVHCIFEDKSGNLWLGTSGGGVTKYDGKYFTHFTEKEGLSDNRVWSIIEDKSGCLWFGTEHGVSKYDGKNITNFTEKEGLPNNKVWSTIVDKNGNIWIATDGGVSKLSMNEADGSVHYTFTNFTKEDGLADNGVSAILEDKRGNLWFGTDNGISKLSITEDKGAIHYTFTNFTEQEGLSDNCIFSILEDKSGNLWFGTDGGVSKLALDEAGGSVQYTFTNYTEKEGLSSNYVLSVFEDKSGNLWFGTDGGGVALLSQDSKSFTYFTEKEGLSNNSIFSILEDKRGNIWLGTDGGGLSKYDGNSFTHFTVKEGLSDNRVWAVLEDKNGNIWLGTDGGVSIFSRSEVEGSVHYSFSNYTEKEGLTNNCVTSIMEDKSGNLWFGSNGGGVTKYDGKFFTHFTEKDGLITNYVFSISEDKSGNLWIGTDGGLSELTQRESRGEVQYTLTNFSKKEGLSDNKIWSIVEDKNGNLWFGTDGGGVTKFSMSGAEESIQYSFTHFTEKEGLSNNYVRSIIEDKSGNLWFGTDGGSCKYDGRSFTYFTEKEGLSNNYIFSIIEDNTGDLWFGTRFGLCKLPVKSQSYLGKIPKKNETFTSPPPDEETNSSLSDIGVKSTNILFKSYGYEDGFLGIGVNAGKSICEDKNGTIWIGANDRLTVYHPDGDVPDTIPPNLQLTSIELFNENINWVNLDPKKDTSIVLGNGVRIGNFEFDNITKWYGLPENLSLAYNNNYLTFNFIGITTKSPKKVKYKFKLEGIDENWSALTSRNEANYGNLSHGTYIFKVKALNSEGYWSNEFIYKFTIRPPWWKTWWFKTIYISAFILSLFVFYRWRTAALRRRQKELETKVREATVEIQQQKEEVTAQRDEIETQKNIIENKNKNITDSIRYAQRIQQAILPMDEKLDKLLADHFVFYQPKDIVSGDFYWAENIVNSGKENFILFAAVDCTGHGVPGAFMSLLGYNGLSQAVKENGLNKPGEILNFLSKYIREMLRQRKEESNVKDGMDLFLCSLNRNTMILEYAGVHNSAYIIRKGELITLKPDNHPIAESFSDEFKSYNNKEIALEPGDTLYLFTDGYLDQFGGKDRKKFMSKRFRELLVEIHSLNMAEQKKRLSEVFEAWKGSNEQYDDVLVMGVRVG